TRIRIYRMHVQHRSALTVFSFLVALTATIASCAPSQKSQPQRETAGSEAPATKPKQVKNVILLIGDGMGPQQIGLLEEYAQHAPSSTYGDRQTALARAMDAGEVGISRHGPANGLVVDSACSASQLASGRPALSESIGLDTRGKPVQTVLELAKSEGKATGLVSDTRITHATPAAFAAHVPHRSMENDIAVQMLEGGVDVMLSGGIRHWIPKSANKPGPIRDDIKNRIGDPLSPSSRREDDRDLLGEAREAGYGVVFDGEALAAADGDRLLGLFASSGMMDGIEYTRQKDAADRVEPTLREMTAKALDVLARDDDGFFLMVEGGQIDWAGHANDAGWLLHEMLKFDATVEYVLEWAAERDDTLVVVTADHETGGFSFGYTRHDVPKAQKIEGGAFEEQPHKPNWNFGSYAQLDGIYGQSATFGDMLREFRNGDEQTPEALAAVVNAHSEFDITVDEAREILEDEPNHFRVDGHDTLSAETFPAVDDFEAFYVFGEEVRADLIGRKMGRGQNVSWSNGTHTHTPVPVVAIGPERYTERVDAMLHHTDIGQLLKDAVLGD
ncbi:MAG: alkaline phosphatase, partial [Myxococcota bacterium]